MAEPKYILWHHTKRAGHWLGWRFLHLFFPGVIHYLTDKYQDRHHHLVADTMYAITAITLVTVNIALGIWWTRIFTPVDVDLNVQVSNVISNHSFDIDIILHNGSEPIDRAELFIHVPPGFTPTKHNQFVQLQEFGEVRVPIGQLDPGEIQHIIIPGWLTGEVGSTQRVTAFLKYYHANHQWEVVDSITYPIHVSSFEVISTFPESILNQEEFTWSIEYTNHGSQPVENAKLQLQLPSDLTVQRVDGGEFSPDGNTITIAHVDAQTKGTITIHSLFSETSDSNKVIGVTVLLEDGFGRFSVQGSQELAADVLRPRIGVEVIPAQRTANLGDRVRYTIRLTNIGDADLDHFTVNADLSGAAFSFSGIYAPEASQNGSRLTWELNQVILPGESVELPFSVPTIASLTDHNLSVSVTASAQAVISDIQVTTISQLTSAIVKFNSRISLDTQILFSGPSGEQFGYGPWPVESDEITAARVFWSIQNINNNVSNARVVTTLPGQVEWAGHSSVSYGSALEYNPATRQVSWNVGDLPADGRTLGVSFEVRILPNWQQVGKRIRFTNETMLSGTDSFTQILLTRTADPVFTPDPVQP